MDLIFATHNENKAKELRGMLPKGIRLLTLNDIGFHDEIEETGTSLEENAKIKAETIYKITGKNVFADDTGLFVEALNGEPGVYSSRYAGTGEDEDNIEKLLRNLENSENRNAFFRTVICLFYKDKDYYLSGEAHGQILKERKGLQGFGYDSVFLPNGFSQSFAEMNPDEKNHISHRFRAVQKLMEFIEKQESCQ